MPCNEIVIIPCVVHCYTIIISPCVMPCNEIVIIPCGTLSYNYYNSLCNAL